MALILLISSFLGNMAFAGGGNVSSPPADLSNISATTLVVGSTGTVIPFISTGTYTPTLTNTTNIAASTAQSVKYLRIGNIVLVSGSVAIDPTTCAETSTELGLTLPLASNLTDTVDLTGNATSLSESVRISADTVNDRATFSWNCEGDAGNQSYLFNFIYHLQ